ncbi:MAG TPA: UvrD-helicase domain-containing protein [Solirubrobacteraceae bacterium]|nr:UvrD-helicase domain-containing protein [Solirubrobacteraceae bacterium]
MSATQNTHAAREGPGQRPVSRRRDILDARQREAVQAPGGPLLILAGAGSGKTRVLTERAATLAHRARDRDRAAVLAITFTNAAAAELRTRVGALIGAAAHERVTVGTFHAVCHRLVRAHAEQIGRSPQFTIYDAHASRRVITRVLKDLQLEETVTVRLVAEQITRAKAHLVNPAGYASLATSPRARQIAEAYARYEQALDDSDALDFDDLLCRAVALLDDPALVARYRARWGAVLVDEYQDTNPAQEAWLQRLGGPAPNLTVVGDPQQAIYSFRGAEVGNILGFEQRFAGTRAVALERNYRSSAAIVAAAARLGAHGAGGQRVRMWTDAPNGAAVTAVAHHDEHQEAQQAAIWCLALLQRGIPAGEIAVLMRTRAQARPIEDSLLLAGVACRLLGGQGLWETAAVRDLVACLTLLCNPRDQLALGRALGTQPGVGAVAIARVLGAAAAHDGDLLTTCAHAAQIPRLAGAQRLGVEAFGRALSELARESEQHGLAATATQTVLATGLARRLRAQGTEHAHEQLEALRRVCRAAGRYERDTQPARLAEFLATGALATDDDQPQDDRVTLCTLHAAKGAEWDHVRIVGLCEGLLPHHRALEDGHLDDERRLAYVGITRARRELCLTWPQRHRGHPTRMSRFVTEAGLALGQRPAGAQRDSDTATGGKTAQRAA